MVSDGSSPRVKATHTPGQAGLDSLSTEAGLAVMVKAGAPRDRRGVRDINAPEEHSTPLGKGFGLMLQRWEMRTCSLSLSSPC